MRRWRHAALAACVALAGCATPPPAADAAAVAFVAIGDMPYDPRERTWPAYEQLIGQINALQPAFTVHVGDFKSGQSRCSDDEFDAQFAFFARFRGALVYTPGDNEWTDCHRLGAGGYDPLERLARLRRQFFAAPQSLGAAPFALQRQADRMPGFAGFPENARFERGGVLVVTLHVVGSNNNRRPDDAAAMAEFAAREDANIAWIRDSFDEARRRQLHALVFAMQANPLAIRDPGVDFPARSGFDRSIGRTLLPLAAQSGRPVLLLHGDTHHFRFDQPFRDASGQPIANLWRLEVFGAPAMHGVQVAVRPGASPPFAATPLLNPLSP